MTQEAKDAKDAADILSALNTTITAIQKVFNATAYTPTLNRTFVEKDFTAAMIASYNDVTFNSTSNGWNKTF